MLDPWIIEEILRREEDRRREDEVGRVIPLETPHYHEKEPAHPGGGRHQHQDEETNRGVVVIDI